MKLNRHFVFPVALVLMALATRYAFTHDAGIAQAIFKFVVVFIQEAVSIVVPEPKPLAEGESLSSRIHGDSLVLGMATIMLGLHYLADLVPLCRSRLQTAVPSLLAWRDRLRNRRLP
jgi:hypothetical protein